MKRLTVKSELFLSPLVLLLLHIVLLRSASIK